MATVPFDRYRLRRAEAFAARIMAVIGPYCDRPGPALDALVAAAYEANATIATDGNGDNIPPVSGKA